MQQSRTQNYSPIPNSCDSKSIIAQEALHEFAICNYGEAPQHSTLILGTGSNSFFGSGVESGWLLWAPHHPEKVSGTLNATHGIFLDKLLDGTSYINLASP